jgi:hypothetical protein
MKTLKQTIKQLASQQSGLKNQRKTVHIQGTRTMDAYKAWVTHRSNRCVLHHLYAAYALLRDKDPALGFPDWKTYCSMDYINKIVDEYKLADND